MFEVVIYSLCTLSLAKIRGNTKPKLGTSLKTNEKNRGNESKPKPRTSLNTTIKGKVSGNESSLVNSKLTVM